jgi:serine/threonine-protein kinase
LDRLKEALTDRYTIEREIGSGGMATVYQAQDLKHERLVAMKVLRPELAAALGPERFLQEIKIAASLHHPHILPLYDSGSADGFLFYVMPFVEGESLRDRLAREKQLAIDDALQVAREVADALSYAHSHGVIHRDIKPENILLESGHAVVADFGIARAVDAAGGERLTETGIAIGTPAYMSPEQAGGEKELDGRSDLYSLGCVLHEMLAGQPPFTGPTVESLVHQHLSAEPPSVTAIRPSVPGWVAAALERSLAKMPADRFNPVAQFGEAISVHVSVADAVQRHEPMTGKRRWIGAGVLAVVLLVVAGAVLVRMMMSGPLTITASNHIQVTSAPGMEFEPAISPNGQEVAYVVGPHSSPRIFLRGTADGGVGGETRLGEGVPGLHWLPRWKPDGASLIFITCPDEEAGGFGGGCADKEGGRLGGAVRNVSLPWQQGGGRWTWSPGGTRMAVALGHDSIFTYSTVNGERRLIGLNAATDPQAPHSLAWSPDGRLIAYVNGNHFWRNSTNLAPSSIWILDANGGDPVAVTDEETMNLSPQWLPDSRHLLYVTNRDGTRGIYVIEVGPDGPRGPPRSVLPSSDPHSISVSADGRKLTYAKFPWQQNVWSIRIPDAGVVSIRDAVRVTKGNHAVENHSLSPDGEWLAFDSNRRGRLDVWKQRVAGGDPVLVADIDGDELFPDWSPDGTEIAFEAIEPDGGDIRVVSADGGTPLQVADWAGDETRPTWSPDGLSLAFRSRGPENAGATYVWIISRERVGGPWGNPVQLNESCTGFVTWGPDDAGLLCVERATGDAMRVSRDGQVLARYDLATLGLRSFHHVEFSSDGSRVYGVGTDQDNAQGIYWVPAVGGRATKVVALDDPSVSRFGYLSVGPEHLFITLSEYESDIWVMDLEW